MEVDVTERYLDWFPPFPFQASNKIRDALVKPLDLYTNFCFATKKLQPENYVSSGTEQLRETVLQEVMTALGSTLGKVFFLKVYSDSTVCYPPGD